MIQLQGPVKCEVKTSEEKGLGVFATEFIQKDEVIEECHIIEVDNLRHPSNLQRYLFSYPKNTNNFRVLPLGFGCIYNHSPNPNATWIDHPSIKAFIFVAIKDIQQGEEICTFYGNIEFPKK